MNEDIYIYIYIYIYIIYIYIYLLAGRLDQGIEDGLDRLDLALDYSKNEFNKKC
jgi:hypothetical protein